MFKEQILFDAVEDMFEQKAPKNEIFDVRGLKAQCVENAMISRR